MQIRNLLQALEGRKTAEDRLAAQAAKDARERQAEAARVGVSLFTDLDLEHFLM